MAMTMHPSLAVHPGDWLKSEVVDPHGVSINRLAAAFHVTRQTLSPENSLRVGGCSASR